MGDYFKENIPEFEYTRGDRKKIFNISAHIKENLEDDNAHYVLKPKQKPNLKFAAYFASFAGYFFVKIPNIVKKNTATGFVEDPAGKDELQIDLIKAAKKYFHPDEWDHLENATKDTVSAFRNGDNEKRGNIKCWLCAQDGTDKTISISSKFTTNREYWILSNMQTHWKTTHGRKKIISSSDFTIPKHKSQNNDENLEHIQINDDEIQTDCDEEIQSDCEEEIQTDSDIENEVHLQEQVNDDLSMASQEDEEEDLVYTQISEQIVLMTETVLRNDLKQYNMRHKLNGAISNIQVVKIKRDGNCLYRAITHQLHRQNLNSRAYEQTVKKLRKDVVSHIKANYDKYLPQLKNSVYEQGNSIMDIDAECYDFLYNKLPKNGTWGGMETLKAVMEIYSVNILSINENGSFYFIDGFNDEYCRTICIAYRLAARAKSGEEQAWNHYDSATLIEQNDIFEVSALLSKKAADENGNKTISLEISQV